MVAYFAYHYARLAGFPVGDDPAIHIYNVKTYSYSQLFNLPYPLPLVIFKFVQAYTHIDYPQLFIYLICTYLYVAAMSFYAFVYKTSGNMALAAGTVLLFVTSRWVNDGLRMGLFAEAFSWSVLFLILTTFSLRKLWLTVPLTAVLVLSHPFATVLYAILILLYSIIVLISPHLKKERPFILKLLGIYLGLALLAWLARPELVQRFLNFVVADPAGWGDRPFMDILTGDDIKRIYIPLMGCLGLIAAVRDWAKPVIRVMFLFLALGLFFSLNYVFGINFIPFRFYVYLEMAVAFFAACGLATLVSRIEHGKFIAVTLTAGLALLLAIPNIGVNQVIGSWQATQPEAHATLTTEDREAIDWIKANTTTKDLFMAARRQGIWIIALADRNNIRLEETHYNDRQIDHIYNTGQLIGVTYLYYSEGHVAQPVIQEHYYRVFSNGSVSIWRVKS